MTLRQYTILIVDDSPEDRATYRRYLSQEVVSEYKIVETECGEDGLEQLASSSPDIILLDYLLPDFNGLEFIQVLKARTEQIPPIIMLTGQGNEAVAVEAMKSGINDYLVKGNLSANVLVASVKNVLQQHRLGTLLKKSFQQQQLIAETALRIRQSLDLTTILNTAVEEVRLLLSCDRVIIYQFAPDMSGNVVAESLSCGWTRSLGQNIVDTCFKNQGADRYLRGESLVINNIYESEFSPCHLQLLEQFEVKAHVVSPLLLTPKPSGNAPYLWGLVITHQCRQFRQWETDEVELLNKLAVQLAIAIQQAELLDSLQKELDTTKRLETELERRVQVLDASEDYIGLADVTGRVIWNNPCMKQMVGITDDEQIRQLTVADYHPPRILNLIKNIAIPTAIAKGTWLGETILKTKDGQEIPVSQLIIAHKSPDGEVEFISTVIRNLSQQKKTENSLKEKALELKWVNQELLKTTSLLKKRNQELDRFAYVTSHDLKAPLRAIANLATWLAEDLEGQLPEENQRQLELMQSRVIRMERLIQGLLEYSRVGRKNNQVIEVSVKNLVCEAIDSLAPPPGFKIAIADDLPTLKTDPLLLQQVFGNLIENAIKYHPQVKGNITILCEEQEQFYRFGVSDDGLGIDPQYHDRIFTIFQTLQARDTIESTGIGLSIVKKIIESQGGKVWVVSQLGDGATFYFTWKKYHSTKS